MKTDKELGKKVNEYLNYRKFECKLPNSYNHDILELNDFYI